MQKFNQNVHNSGKSLDVHRNLDDTKLRLKCGDVMNFIHCWWEWRPGSHSRENSGSVGKIKDSTQSCSLVQVSKKKILKKTPKNHKGHVQGCLCKVTLFVLANIHTPYNLYHLIRVILSGVYIFQKNSHTDSWGVTCEVVLYQVNCGKKGAGSNLRAYY